jgi:hypothetical protein
VGTRESNIPYKFKVLGVNNINVVGLFSLLPAPTFYVIVFVYGIKNRTIHARRQLYVIKNGIVRCAYQVDGPEVIVAISDEDSVGVKIHNSVRLGKTFDGMDGFTRSEIQYFDALVILSYHEQPVTLDIGSKVFKVSDITRQQRGVY